MDFLWFMKKKQKKEEKLKEAFSTIKKEFGKTGDWLTHLHRRDSNHENSITEISRKVSDVEIDLQGVKEEVSEMKTELYDLKEALSLFAPRVFKQRQTAVYKQTAVQGVQTPVQTGVQTAIKNEIFGNLTTMERAILWVLLNTEMKLSYEDIASLLGKDRATVRGQINSIRQKTEGVVEEVIEKTGKKRVFVPEEMRNALLKGMRTETKDRKSVV